MTFSDCGQASSGGSGDVRLRLEREAAPQDALSRPARSWRARSCFLGASWTVQLDGRGAEGWAGGDRWGVLPLPYPALQGRLTAKFGFPGFPWAPEVPEAHTREAGGSSGRPGKATLKLPTRLAAPSGL